MTRRFRSLPDLAARLDALAREGKTARLSPQTIHLVVTALNSFAQEPTRDEVATVICTSRPKCDRPCISCQGKANEIVRLYRGEDGPFDPEPMLPAGRPGLSLVSAKSGNR